MGTQEIQATNDGRRAAPIKDETGIRRLASGILVVIGLGGVLDIVLDRPETLWDSHILFELALLAFALGSAAYLALGWGRVDSSLVRAKRDLATASREREAWRARSEKFLRGLGEEIERQFDHWGLTPTEGETALLVLKGLSYKEIAAIQGKSERTVRQHSLSVFRKSGVAGRSEFAAFFLEDLLLPRHPSAEASSEAAAAAL